MHANRTAEVIARFVGMFGPGNDLYQRPQAINAFESEVGRISPADLDEIHRSSRPDDVGNRTFDPNLDFDGNRFHIEHGTSGPIRLPSVELDVPPLQKLPVDIPEADFEADLSHPIHLAIHHRVKIVHTSIDHHNDTPPERHLTIDYEDAGPISVLGTSSQTTLLDDRDVLVMGDKDPIVFVEDVARSLEDLVAVARSGSSLPHVVPASGAEYPNLLRTSAWNNDEAGRGEGAVTGHEGVYVHGIRVDVVPALDAFKEALTPENDASSPSGLDVSTGGNVLLNQAAVLNVSQLAPIMMVGGDWHETNSIRQITILSDDDTITGPNCAPLGLSGDNTVLDVAIFERKDIGVLDGKPPPQLSSFPSHYTVDVVQGDLLLTHFLRQMHMTLDGDSAVLTQVDHDLSVRLGDNQVVGLSDLLLASKNYDLVVIGGHVFEGNYIEQINVLMDSDKLTSEIDLPAGAVTGSGNQLLNYAAIQNYGSVSGIGELSPSMKALMDSFASGVPGGDASVLGADLAYLRAQDIKVLYVTGNYYELNVISQMNVLGDSDTLAIQHGPIADFLNAGHGNWTVDTGSNTLVNQAAITDFDAADRFVGGSYYSDSMLHQAELVGREGIETFDTQKLAPEIIAFTTDDIAAHAHDVPSPASPPQHDIHTDGIAGILA